MCYIDEIIYNQAACSTVRSLVSPAYLPSSPWNLTAFLPRCSACFPLRNGSIFIRGIRKKRYTIRFVFQSNMHK